MKRSYGLNFDGKIVYENALSGSSEELHYYLNKNELTSGMYFYKISSGEEVYSGKIVIE